MLAGQIVLGPIIIAMGLHAMGVANEIVNLAFALVLGAVAVAAALAFGLGGRNVAARELEAVLLMVACCSAGGCALAAR